MSERSTGGGGGPRDPAAGGEGAAEASRAPAAGASSGGRPRSIPAWAGLALLLAAAIALYLPALSTPFFADDFLFLDQVRGRSLLQALAAPDPLSNFFRPIGRQLYFWLIASASGESPRVFHAVNLGLFLALVALFFAIARRVVGARAAVIATALVALSHTADVPVRWAAGAQELLAVVGALGAILLHLSGRRVAAAVALLLAALSKETALVTPLIAVVLDKDRDEPWLATLRRAAPLGAAVIAWGTLWLVAPGRHAQLGTNVGLEPAGPVAALAHLVQTVLGAEWRKGGFGNLPRAMPEIVPLALALAAVWYAAASSTEPSPAAPVTAEKPKASKGRTPRSSERRESGAARIARRPAADTARGLWAGVSWTLIATAPVALVAPIWSAYYYLFAICGAALAIGSWLATRSASVALGVVAALAVGSASARGLDEFAVARTPWTGQSHINRFYIDRATRNVERYLGSLRRQRPTLPHGTTLFFGGLKGNVAFQTTDGPLLRWAYRDSSLRSYYLNDFTLERARGGAPLIFIAEGDTLKEMQQDSELYLRLASSMIVSDRPRSARDMLLLQLQRDPRSPRAHYWSTWAQWALGDSLGALESLRQSGVTPHAGAARAIEATFAALQIRDTTTALRVIRGAVVANGLDAGAHALLADLLLVRNRDDIDGTIEAYAARVLVPEQPYAWRRWGMVQAHHERYLESLASFERYFVLIGSGGDQDQEARRWLESIRSMLPGGDLAAEGLRE